MRKIRIFLVSFLALVSVAEGQTVTRRQPVPVMGATGADWLTHPFFPLVFEFKLAVLMKEACDVKN